MPTLKKLGCIILVGLGILAFPKCISVEHKCVLENLQNLMISISANNGGMEITEKWNTYDSITCE